MVEVELVQDTIQLIGDDRILHISRRGQVQLYDFPEPEDFHGYTEPQYQGISNREPISSLSIPGNTSGIHTSPVYFDGTTYRIIAIMSTGIWLLVLNATKDDSLSIIQFSNVPSWPRFCIPRLHKAYALNGKDGAGVRIGYSWGDNDIPAVTYSSGEPKNFTLYSAPNFDEESGRFVFLVGSDIVIVDFLHQFAETNHE